MSLVDTLPSLARMGPKSASAQERVAAARSPNCFDFVPCPNAQRRSLLCESHHPVNWTLPRSKRKLGTDTALAGNVKRTYRQSEILYRHALRLEQCHLGGIETTRTRTDHHLADLNQLPVM